MYEKELKAMIRAAKIAEKHILKIYSTNFEVEIKSAVISLHFHRAHLHFLSLYLLKFHARLELM